jgi:hypothetical protein
MITTITGYVPKAVYQRAYLKMAKDHMKLYLGDNKKSYNMPTKKIKITITVEEVT